MSEHLCLPLVALLTFIAGTFILNCRANIEPFLVRREDLRAVQCSHVGNPLRLGGLAIFLSLIIGIYFNTSGAIEQREGLLLLSVIPVLVAGALEDLGYGVSPLGRFLAAFASAILAMYSLNVWVSRMDVAGVDLLLSAPIIGILFTIIFSAGFCHAVNLIDGMNGLAICNILVAATGCAVVAEFADIKSVGSFAMLLAAASAGFLILNWPVARLFLGDAGAYGLGHLLVWQVFMLVSLSDEVAVPAAALLIFWPMADVVHTIGRRLIAGRSILLPDKMHLHQKVRRALDILWFGKKGRTISNPLATVVLLPLMLGPVMSGIIFWNNAAAAWLTLVGFMFMFSAAHPLTVWMASSLRPDHRQSIISTDRIKSLNKWRSGNEK